MRIVTITSIIIYSTILPAFAFEQSNSYLPGEYPGFIEYYTVDSIGRDIIIKMPVLYRKITNMDYAKNDLNGTARDCHIELERANQKLEAESQKHYDAKYYPLYYSQ